MNIAEYVWDSKYRQKGEKSISDTFRRVSKYVSNGVLFGDRENFERIFFKLMEERKFIPGGRILANAGTKIKNNSNCFTLKIRDSRESIFQALKDSAEIFAWGGGIGYNFSHLREKGAPISIGGSSSGVLSFMKLFDETAEVIKIRSRRGAMMGQLDVSHPEIIDFINLKSQLTQKQQTVLHRLRTQLGVDEETIKKVELAFRDTNFNHFNISVRFTRDFFDKVKKDEEWELISPLDNSVRKKVSARGLLYVIAKKAWETGDPGFVFIDRINEDELMLSVWGPPEASNPCLIGDTLIKDGDKFVRIIDIVLDEKRFTGRLAILDRDPVYGSVTSKVYETDTFYVWSTGKKPVITLVSETGRSITLTKEHLLLKEDGTWVEAQHSLGERIKTINGVEKIIQIVDDGSVRDVYDFKMKKDNIHWNYANGFVVHNCSELYLYPYESCVLGSINLAAHTYKFEGRWFINWNELARTAFFATIFLDAVVEIDENLVKDINETQKFLRRIGLGIMGWSDLLLRLDIPYGSEESIRLSKEIMDFITRISVMTSNFIARNTSPAPFWTLHNSELNTHFLDKLFSYDLKNYGAKTAYEMLLLRGLGLKEYEGNITKYPLRNVSWTSIAPTGSISIIAGASQSIEPYFKLVYKRNVELGEDRVQRVEYIKVAEVERKLREDLLMTDEEIEKFYKEYTEGGIENVAVLKDIEKRALVDSHSLTPKEHIDVQAGFQEFTSNSISKTVNMPNHATVDDVFNAIIYMNDSGIKSSTIYRDGSKVFQILE